MKKHILVFVLGLCASAVLVKPASSEEMFDRHAAFFHVLHLHGLYIGMTQSIYIACGGDVSKYANKFIKVANFLESQKYEEYKKFYAGSFGNGMDMGEAYGCNMTKYETYSDWEKILYEALIN